MTNLTVWRPTRSTAIAFGVCLLLALSLLPTGGALAQSNIRVLVNDDAITSFDIKQRTQMLRVFSRNRQGEKEAIEQLIDERLMLQEAKLRGASAGEEEVDQEIAKRARAAKLGAAQFQQAMRQAGFDPQTFRDFVHANMVWQKIVRARFRATVEVTDQDVAAALTERAEGPESTEVQQTFEYMLQPIIFVLPAGAGAGVEAQRRSEATAFRASFQGCENTLQQVAGAPGIVVKPQTRREEGQMSAPLKEAVAGLEVGGITQPEKVSEGIQILGICAKHGIEGETTATVEVREELTSERGELLARRYLRDLRSDAVIEYR